MNSLENIARQFVVFDRWLTTSIIGKGHIHDTYQTEVEWNGQKYSFILQRINTHIFKNPYGLMQNIRLVSQHLSESNYPLAVVSPIESKTGCLCFQDSDGAFWRCYPFLPNTIAPETGADIPLAREAARAYGAFSKALSGFPAAQLIETIPGFHDTEARWRNFIDVLKKDPIGRAANTTKEIDQMDTARLIFDQIRQMKESGAWPMRVTHNDTKAGNVLFDNQTGLAVAVIDLDTVMPGVILSDFGDMVRTFVPEQPEDFDGPVSLRPGMLEALMEGFLSEMGEILTPEEKNSLLLGGVWISGEQALRFLSDWLAGDLYYKIAYPEHNFVRAKNQLSLFQALWAHYKHMI